MKLGLITSIALALAGCNYSGVSALGNDRVVIAQSSGFGLGRKIFVCKVTNDGVSACQSADNP